MPVFESIDENPLFWDSLSTIQKNAFLERDRDAWKNRTTRAGELLSRALADLEYLFDLAQHKEGGGCPDENLLSEISEFLILDSYGRTPYTRRRYQ